MSGAVADFKSFEEDIFGDWPVIFSSLQAGSKTHSVSIILVNFSCFIKRLQLFINLNDF